MNKSKVILFIFLSMVLVTSIISCSSNLPDVTDAFDPGATFTQTLYEPKLGRDNLMTGNFNPGSSTLPFTMEIVNMRKYDGSEAPELTEYFPVTVWKTPYLGTETSLQEIEDKRTIENRSLFQVRKHSGEFIMWAKANSSFVSCSPGAGYIFDVKVENSGGRKYYTGMRLIPERESAYEPSSVDPESGVDTAAYVHPLSMQNVYTTNSTAYSSYQGMYILSTEDVQVYFHKDLDLDEKDPTLTFRFYKSDYTLINPDKFNLTNWKKLVHGFDMVKDTTEKFVRYKVAYPVPLSEMVTDYTNDSGESAEVTFGYNWMFNGNGRRYDAEITFDFAIYEEGHWDINFVFAGGDPYFGDNN